MQLAQCPVSHENVRSDLDGLEQVYDIISVLPLQEIWQQQLDPSTWSPAMKTVPESQDRKSFLVLHSCQTE